MNSSSLSHWIAFSGNQRVSSGTPYQVASDVKRFIDLQADQSILIFDAETSEPVEMDFRGNLQDILERLPVESKKETPNATKLPTSDKPAAGRPKLGVVAREVTLLPRHWEWLSTQPGGASVTLRKLVEHALRVAKETDISRQRQEATYRFMTAMAGNYPGFEEAARALFAGDIDQFKQITGNWPVDVRNHLFFLADALNVSREEKD